MLTRVRFKGYKSFHDVAMRLSPLAVRFGPNAAGKSNLLDLGEVELRIREAGVAIPARVLSDGTLRMLGLLALAGTKGPPALVGFEEQENGAAREEEQ